MSKRKRIKAEDKIQIAKASANLREYFLISANSLQAAISFDAYGGTYLLTYLFYSN